MPPARFLTQANLWRQFERHRRRAGARLCRWINNQLSFRHPCPANVLANPYSDPTDLYQSHCGSTPGGAIHHGPDQLRQRVAFALSEIFVVSKMARCKIMPTPFPPTMTCSSTMRSATSAPDRSVSSILRWGCTSAWRATTRAASSRIHADENYAREVQQLFSVGLNRLWPDGTLILNSQDNLVPTYNQNVVMGFASVFTGWAYHQTNQANAGCRRTFSRRKLYQFHGARPTHHELGTKLLLDNVMLPQAWAARAIPPSPISTFIARRIWNLR